MWPVPDVQWKRLGRCEALWESSRLGDMPREDGGVAMPHSEEGLHRGSFPPQEEFSSLFEFCTNRSKFSQIHSVQQKPGNQPSMEIKCAEAGKHLKHARQRAR